MYKGPQPSNFFKPIKMWFWKLHWEVYSIVIVSNRITFIITWAVRHRVEVSPLFFFMFFFLVAVVLRVHYANAESTFLKA